MGNSVYITEWKSMNLAELPKDWKVYHFSPMCPALVNNPNRSCDRLEEKDDDTLDSLGFRFCNHQCCLAAGIERGIFTEGGAESYYPDKHEVESLRKSGQIH
jgi:hypothetical protein